MNKQDLIDRQDLIDLIVARGAATRQQLWRKSDEELVKLLDASLLAGIRAEVRAQVLNTPEMVQRQRKIDEINADRLWTRFFFSHPEISDNLANRKLLFDYSLSLSDDGVLTFQHLDEAAKTLPGLAHQKVKHIPTTANLKQDEETLQEFCRANRLELNTAALNLLRQEFGAGFDSGQIAQALKSGTGCD